MPKIVFLKKRDTSNGPNILANFKRKFVAEHFQK